MEPRTPVRDADDELQVDDSGDDLPDIADAPDVDPIEVTDHSEDDRDT